MSFTDKHADVLYILVSFKLHIGNDMDSGHYVCDLLDYNKGIWWNFCVILEIFISFKIVL